MISKITLDQLRVLVTISDKGSFSAAGRALNRVQSAISQSVKNLEEAQDVKLFNRNSNQKLTPTGVGLVLIEQARMILESTNRFEAIASGTRLGLEPELTLAIDSLVPSQPLIESLRALKEMFPDLPVTVTTDGVGGAERRLREGAAALAVCLLLPKVPEDLVAHSLMELKLMPVVASGHPLARIRRVLERADLEGYVQLVLSDAQGTDGPKYGIAGNRVWRFFDQTRRLDFLLAGFGWCKMPPDLVQPFINNRSLIKLKIEDESLAPSGSLPIYCAHVRSRPLGRAGAWLIEDLRKRLSREK
ncbi:MAG: LysR family transcriptional regulator [Bdellovibrio sp.]|nr:LysR family transcriptional regulator [Bdellovibrio sp.]